MGRSSNHSVKDYDGTQSEFEHFLRESARIFGGEMFI